MSVFRIAFLILMFFVGFIGMKQYKERNIPQEEDCRPVCVRLYGEDIQSCWDNCLRHHPKGLPCLKKCLTDWDCFEECVK